MPSHAGPQGKPRLLTRMTSMRRRRPAAVRNVAKMWSSLRPYARGCEQPTRAHHDPKGDQPLLANSTPAHPRPHMFTCQTPHLPAARRWRPSNRP